MVELRVYRDRGWRRVLVSHLRSAGNLLLLNLNAARRRATTLLWQLYYEREVTRG